MVIARILMRRIPQLVVVLLGVTFLTFVLLNLLPGNVAALILGQNATKTSIVQLSHQLGLDRPLMTRYFDWLGGALHGNFGRSVLNGEPVWQTVMQRAPVTLELFVLSTLIAMLAAIPTAALAARRPGGIADRVIGVFAFGLLSTPNFLAGLILILVFSVGLKVLPVSGWAPISDGLGPNLQHAVLPTLALAAAPFGFYTRLLRGDMIEQLTRQDYVVTARAKGMSSRRVLLVHVLRNALFPMITMVGLSTGIVVGGAVVVENVFGVPGIGQLLVQGIDTRDVTVVLGVVVFIAVAVVLVNLLIDVLYGVLDPRVRLERTDS